jgi:hypothetical protein
MRWIILSALLLLVGRPATGSRRRSGSNAAVRRLGCGSVAGELPFPGVKEAVGELLSETSLRSCGELLSGFFELGAKGLEDHQLGVVLFNALARKVISRFYNRDWS